MLYSDLIRQETEYTYSANVQFDIENDKKLARFIPNETTIELFREYFVDTIRTNPNHHSRILYGSYGTGKSHFLTVLSLLLSKAFTDGVAFDTFLTRVNEYDPNLAQDINAFVKDETRKPFLIVPIVFDFADFDRCIYFSLTKKLNSIGISVRFKTFYTQALEQLSRWKEDEESLNRLKSTCDKEKINLSDLEKSLTAFDSKAESVFNRLFNKMTFGVNFVCEVSNLTESLTQATEAISSQYSGMVFIFDEFGRYIEDNIKKIKVRSVQDLAEYCDHGNGNNHIILVSHKEISLYTQRISKTLSNEWKKIEGRYKATPINDKQDQCLSLIKSVLIKEEKPWASFKQKYNSELQAMYNEALDFHGFLVDVARHENPFEGGFPLHPISLYALDKLSKKVAQNERTFFTYLASREENSLYRFLTTHEDDAFSFVGIDEIYDYFELSIKSLQSDASYEWYKKLQTALSKNKSNAYDNTPEVRILKVIAAIGVINDSSVLVANKKTITSVINLPKDIVANSIDALCEKKILKYSGSYDRYDFFDSSIYDVDKMIAEESVLIKDERVVKTLNEDFINFVLYPHQYNNEYKISRVFVPVFALPTDLSRRNLGNPYGKYYDGLLVFVLGNEDTDTEQVVQDSANIDRSIVVLNTDTQALKDAVKQYIAICYLESQKAKYIAKDPSFEKELQYYKDEVCELVFRNISSWKQIYDDSFVIVSNGATDTTVTSYADLTTLASQIMAAVYPKTLIVNNELINKNVVSGSIASAKKNALREMLKGEAPDQYYGLSLLSPEYISVRSVLAKNGFITPEVPVVTNILASGDTPQTALNNCLQNFIERAQNEEVEFGDLYAELKSAPYGLRDGYLSLLLANALLQYRKSLIISSHGSEQELTVELFEDIVKRPDDFSFTIASWTKKELDYLDALEQLFSDYVDPNNLSKNRLKAIYEAMFSHYKNVSKFARTSQAYVTAETKAYRKLLEKSYSSYSDFVFKKLKTIGGSYEATLITIKTIKLELESAINELCVDLAHSICTLFNYETNTSLAQLLSQKYRTEWVAKRQKSFDYCTNAFLEFTSTVGESELDCNVIVSLSKSLTGFELMYWSDSHKAEFLDKLKDIKDKLDAYEVKSSLGESETRMTLKTSDGQEKSVVFDRSDLSPLSQTIKNKINATFNNYGMSVTYDDTNVGFLSFTGEETIFPVDGQHRVAGIIESIKENEDLKNEQVPVIFIAHNNNDAGKKKTRKLFSTLNRRAKPVGQNENIALDEDDVCSIITRDLVQEMPLFSGNNIVNSLGKQIPNSNETAITSLITLYQCVDVIVKHELAKEKITGNKYKQYLLYRPNDNDVERLKAYVFNAFESFKNNIDDIRNYVVSEKTNKAASYRNSNGGNLLFRPIAITEFFAAANILIDRKAYSVDGVFKALNGIVFDINASPWKGLVWDGSKIINRASKQVIKLLIVHMVDADCLTTQEKKKLLEGYCSSLNISEGEANNILNRYKKTRND